MSASSKEYQLLPYKPDKPDNQAELLKFFVGVSHGNTTRADDLMAHVLTSSSIVVAKHNNTIIGYRHVYKDTALSAHFHQAAVLPDYRRRGVFTTLLDTVIVQFGNRTITADISRNAHHLETMKRVGFEIESELDGWRYRIKRPGRSVFRFPVWRKML